MFKFTKDVEISVNLLNMLTDQPIKAIEAAERCSTSLPMMNMVASKLRRAGLIKTKKGRNGGIYTDRKDDISIFEVISVYYDDPSSDLRLAQSTAGNLNETVIDFFRALPVSGIPNEPLSELKRHERLVGDDEYSGESFIVWEEEVPVSDNDFDKMLDAESDEPNEALKELMKDDDEDEEDEELGWD